MKPTLFLHLTNWWWESNHGEKCIYISPLERFHYIVWWETQNGNVKCNRYEQVRYLSDF